MLNAYKFVYYINANATTTTNNNYNNNKVTGIAELNAFSCANKNEEQLGECTENAENRNIFSKCKNRFFILFFSVHK